MRSAQSTSVEDDEGGDEDCANFVVYTCDSSAGTILQSFHADRTCSGETGPAYPMPYTLDTCYPNDDEMEDDAATGRGDWVKGSCEGTSLTLTYYSASDCDSLSVTPGAMPIPFCTPECDKDSDGERASPLCQPDN